MSRAPAIVGLKEVSWPRGKAYLYYKRRAAHREIPLAWLDVYEVDRAQLRKALSSALQELTRREAVSESELMSLLESIAGENMQAWLLEELQAVAAELSGHPGSGISRGNDRTQLAGGAILPDLRDARAPNARREL